ncbi:NAD-dependent protein deacetylase sirtuin-1 [Rhizophlyctis rosea]|uniref:NAD-dependent protein deacetylase sirtuin-1 n=1 Tax=Rhizophlyctis rosea TaxID=64517 RepID=A0AAD5X1H8_9FUNG|nr:NAD-dependent protein deacetylase sirtuin-1 [Rhizophlyctis rosea]
MLDRQSRDSDDEPPTKRLRQTLADDHNESTSLELGDDVQTIVTETLFAEPATPEGVAEAIDVIAGERRLVSGHEDGEEEEEESEAPRETPERSPSPMKYVLSQTAKEVMQDDARHLDFWEWLEKYYPRFPIQTLLDAFDCEAPSDMDMDDFHELLPLLKSAIMHKTARRKKRDDINTIEDVVRLLKESKNIVVLTGAGVSVSCGIPDFRSKNGIYSRLDEFELNDPQEMFDIHYFRDKPETFYTFAKEIYPSNFQPSPSHMFIKLLEQKGKLLRNYTQNIDTLEQVAGIQKVVQCHGSFATARCINCKYEVPGDALEKDIFAQTVPMCPKCPEDEDYRIMKPDIVFFGEKLPDEFDRRFAEDKEKLDLLIVMGSSLKVSPVADVKDKIPHDVPQILINLEALPHMAGFDVQLLGYCDSVVVELCKLLGWQLKHEKVQKKEEEEKVEEEKETEYAAGGEGSSSEEPKLPWIQGRYLHQHLFEGALMIGDMQAGSWVPDSDEDDDGEGSSSSREDSTSSDDEEGEEGKGSESRDTPEAEMEEVNQRDEDDTSAQTPDIEETLNSTPG